MPVEREIPTLQQTTRLIQIIAAAMILGVVLFAGVAVFLSYGKSPGDLILASAAALAGVFSLTARSFVPRMFARQPFEVDGQKMRPVPMEKWPALNDEEKQRRLGMTYFLGKIIDLAICEGAAMLNVVAYLIAAHWWSLAMAGLLLAAMAVSFPTRGRIEDRVMLMQQQFDALA